MPATSDFTSVLDRQLLVQLGGRLKRARQRQGLTSTALAQRVGISRTTLHAVEAGDPAPTMGTYLRVMSALGVSGDLALVATDTLRPQEAQKTPRRRREAPKVGVTVSASSAQHELQDLQSLMLHKEAVRLMKERPELLEQAQATLERWRATGDVHSRFLWDEWAVILHRREWRKALARTRRAQELRQASPLPTVLPPGVRDDILLQIKQLKQGVVLGAPPR